MDETGAFLYFIGGAGAEVRVGITVDAEPYADVRSAFLRFSGKGRPVDGVGVDEGAGEDDGIGVDVVVVNGFELSVVLIDVSLIFPIKVAVFRVVMS
jgi:hypothetical protein